MRARKAKVNYIDETSWFMNGGLMWLWATANTTVAYFMIHPNRSKEAFLALTDDWAGILVRDGYGLYRKWINLRRQRGFPKKRTSKSPLSATRP